MLQKFQAANFADGLLRSGTSFLLTSTVFQPAFASMSHIFGRKPVGFSLPIVVYEVLNLSRLDPLHRACFLWRRRLISWHFEHFHAYACRKVIARRWGWRHIRA